MCGPRSAAALNSVIALLAMSVFIVGVILTSRTLPTWPEDPCQQPRYWSNDQSKVNQFKISVVVGGVLLITAASLASCGAGLGTFGRFQQDPSLKGMHVSAVVLLAAGIVLIVMYFAFSIYALCQLAVECDGRTCGHRNCHHLAYPTVWHKSVWQTYHVDDGTGCPVCCHPGQTNIGMTEDQNAEVCDKLRKQLLPASLVFTPLLIIAISVSTGCSCEACCCPQQSKAPPQLAQSTPPVVVGHVVETNRLPQPAQSTPPGIGIEQTETNNRW